MQSSLKDMEDAFKGVVKGLNPIADKFDWLTNFLSKYGMLVMLAVQALPIFTSGLKFAKAGLDKLGALREMKSLKAEADKPRTATTIDKSGKERHYELDEKGKKTRISQEKFDQLNAPGAAPGTAAPGRGGIRGKLDAAKERLNSIPGAKLIGGTLAVAQMATSAYAAYQEVSAKQKEYEAAKAAGDKEGMAAARAEQGGAIGGTVGSMAGGAIGMALLGPVGASIGAFVGEKFGSFLGEKIGPYWDDLGNKAKEMWAGTKQAFSSAWDSSKKVVGDILTSMGTGIMNVGKSVLSFLVDMGKTVFDGIMTVGRSIFAFFGKIGTFIWDGIKASPLFKVGAYIWLSLIHI